MFSIIKKVKLIEKKKVVIAAFDLDYKIFIVYIAIFNIYFDLGIEMNLSKKA